jgi:hypothetical protein
MDSPDWTLIVMDGVFAICRLGGDASIPDWATASDFYSITRSADELSVVCRQETVPEGIRAERDWICLRVSDNVPFSVVGLLASLTGAMAEAGVSVFAISTFDTDYVLVKQKDLAAAVEALRGQGHSVV